MAGAGAQQLASHDLNFVSGPFAEDLCAQSGGFIGQDFRLDWFNGFDSTQGNVPAEFSVWVFGCEAVSGKLEGVLQTR